MTPVAQKLFLFYCPSLCLCVCFRSKNPWPRSRPWVFTSEFSLKRFMYLNPTFDWRTLPLESPCCFGRNNFLAFVGLFKSYQWARKISKMYQPLQMEVTSSLLWREEKPVCCLSLLECSWWHILVSIMGVLVLTLGLVLIIYNSSHRVAFSVGICMAVACLLPQSCASCV